MFLSTNKARPNTANEIPRYFLSLGAGQHQLSLIQAARDLGLRVIAVDRNLGAPGFRFADLQLQCSILRPRRIIRMLAENMTEGRIVGVGCRSFGRANVAAALVAHHFRTPGPTLAHLKHFRDKRANKLLLQKAGVSMPRIFTWDSNAGRLALSSARPPLIVRPAIGHGKVGLQLLNTHEDIQGFLAAYPEDDGNWLVEEYVHGPEVTVMGIVHDGLFQTVCMTDKIVSRNRPFCAEIKHVFPTSISEGWQSGISLEMQKIVEATGMRNGPMVAEFILEQNEVGQEQICLVECSPETGGEYLADVLVPAAFKDVNYFHDLVRLYTGQYPKVPTHRIEPGHRVIIRFLPQQEGTLKSFAFPERLLRHPDLVFARVLKEAGAVTSLDAGNHDRLAVFALRQKMEQADSLDAQVEALAAACIIEYE